MADKKLNHNLRKRSVVLGMSAVLSVLMLGTSGPLSTKAEAAESSGTISNKSLNATIGDLGQISVLNILNNRTNNSGDEINFVLPNDTSPQNDVQHQWMGEMIFSYRTGDSAEFPDNRDGFVEVDTNKTLAAGGSTTYSDAAGNLAANPYIKKNVVDDKKVEINFVGQDENSTDERTMKGFDVQSTYDMDTKDGSLLWSITIKNKSSKYIEFGDVGLPMPWNNKYTDQNSVYSERVTAHTFAGADSGYAYAIRCSGEGNYMMFSPVSESGARIEYVDNWVGTNNGVTGERSDSLFTNWTSDSGGWQPGLSVYYIHSKDIQKTGRGYYKDATSLILAPNESKTYQFKFNAVRAGDNDPQESASDENNSSDSMAERETNMHSILYNSGMIDAVAVPGFQTAINMPAKLDLHYDDSLVEVESVEIQCVHENDPYDEEHIPEQGDGLVNNSRTGRGAHDGNPDYTESCELAETKVVDGEQHHIYNLSFGCIGNNSVRVNYRLKSGDQTEKFTQFEFNVLTELDTALETHSEFMVDEQQDTDPESDTYGIYSDWFLSSGLDTTAETHWGDDWSHDNINSITMKNYLMPNAKEVASIETYLIDFMWERYMKNTQNTYTIANYLGASSIYSDTESPYVRTYSEMMEATGFFNMYRIERAYPDLMEYRETPEFYLEKAYNIYYNRVDSGTIGFYGEQQIPTMIEALKTEGMTEEAQQLQEKFALDKGGAMTTAEYPYGSEFVYDNTGEEGAYAAANALRTYYPDDERADDAESKMSMAEWKTRAMRGIQPTWYQYADPVFLGGESWWNFQYTASLAGSIMDDWLRYQDNGWNTDTSAWAQRVNYAAKLSNFNAINMGQISADSVGSVSWRYTMYKGGTGAMNVNDGGTRVMNNGWNDFSGESDEGIYGSLLSISSDVVNDPIFGLFGYGSNVSQSDSQYTVVPLDGIGKRINLIDEKIYLSLEQDECTQAVMAKDGSSFELQLNNLTKDEHVSRIDLSGAGFENGYYSVSVNGTKVGQCFVKDNQGIANAVIPAGDTAAVSVEKMDGGENEAPVVSAKAAEGEKQALVSFELKGTAYDDGAPDGKLTYTWEAVKTPKDAALKFTDEKTLDTQVAGSAAGEYTVKFTASDGELETSAEVKLTLGEAPDRQAPTIGSVTAVQDGMNISVADLKGEAVSDPLYQGELSYEWSVVSKPDDSQVILVDKDQAAARMKADKPGEYVLRFTAIDAETSAYKDITINMTGDVDGADRGESVITKKGTAPELPEEIEVIQTDGTVKTEEVNWDTVEAEQYAEEGEFLVKGTAKDSDQNAAVLVYVVAGSEANVALTATPTGIVDTVSDLGGVAGLNDGYEPASSRDTSHGVWHNWQGDQGGEAWVQYTWDEAILLISTDAYYFTDGNFVPKTVKYQYLDEQGNWADMKNAKGMGTELDQYNHTSFAPVRTTAIRMVMTPQTVGCGVIEWKVSGYTDAVIADKTALQAAITETGALAEEEYTQETWEKLKQALARAEAVNADAQADQEDIDSALASLNQVREALVKMPEEGIRNMAPAAVPAGSADYVDDLGGVKGLNDEFDPANSEDLTHGAWHNWNDRTTDAWVTYTWDKPVVLSSTDVYYFRNGAGSFQPESVSFEYKNDEGEWASVPNAVGLGVEIDKYNNTTFDEITTTAIRMSMTPEALEGDDIGNNGCGVIEWKVYGQYKDDIQAVDKAALEVAIAEAAAKVQETYTEDSWAEFTAAKTEAEAVFNNAKATQEEVNNAVTALNEKMGALVEKTPEQTIDSQAVPSAGTAGSGTLDGINNGVEPSDSSDTSNGVWHTDGDAQVQYTWNEEVTINQSDVYFLNFLSNGEDGTYLPEAVSYEYLDSEGVWQSVVVTGETEIAADQYNVCTFEPVKTTALRMTMQKQADAAGVGLLSWKVHESDAQVIDKAGLNAAIKIADEKKEKDYTAETWQTLKDALDAAKAVQADAAASQAEVDQAKDALLTAIQNLAEKPQPDLTAIKETVKYTEQKVESDYTKESWAVFADAKKQAEDLISKAEKEPDQVTQEEINAADQKLKDAMGALVPTDVVDKNVLKALLEECEGLKEKEYTEDSWKTFKAAQNAAQAVLDNEDATQDEVNEQVSLLTEAKNQLVKTPEAQEVDKADLKKTIDEAGKIKNDGYTDESWKAFETALDNAKKTSDNKEASQAEVDKSNKELKEAMLNLKKPGQKPTGNSGTSGNSSTAGKGNATTSAKQTASAKTGDQAPILLLGVILLGSAAAIVLVLKKKRKRS